MAPFPYAGTFSLNNKKKNIISGRSLRHVVTIDSAYKRYRKIRHSTEKAIAETEKKKTLITFFLKKRSEKASY